MLNKEKMKKAGEVAMNILNEVGKIIKPGISTLEINDFALDLMNKAGARSGSLGYYGFPGALCTSVNDVICHGIPSKNVILKSGDFLNVDIALEYDGHYGDTSRCFFVGKVVDKTKNLVMTTYEAMWAAIAECGPSVPLNLIGRTIENHIKNTNFSIVKQFCGHGIGTEMHKKPDVLHYYEGENKEVLQAGMAITIEPMINGSKNWKCRVLSDGWTAKTIDGSMSAQWEHTIYITENGCEVMTYNEFDKEKKKEKIFIKN